MDEQELRDLGVSTHAGFPNAAVGSASKQLDLTKLLIKHPSATYLMQIEGDLWNDAGIFDGDIAVVDRSLDPRVTDVVIWYDAEQLLISHKSAVPLDQPTWGVVTAIIHRRRM